MDLQEKISNILNDTKAYEQLGLLMTEIGLDQSSLADLAYHIEEAIETILLDSKGTL